MEENCYPISETPTLPLKVAKPLFCQKEGHDDAIIYSKQPLPIRNITSNLTRQFEIYNDPPIFSNSLADGNKSFENLRNIEQNKSIENNNTIMRKHRVFSDIVFTKRDISFDDRMFLMRRLNHVSSLHSLGNSFESKREDKFKKYNKNIFLPLKRKPLTQISPITDNPNNSYLLKNDMYNDNDENTKDHIGDSSDNEENRRGHITDNSSSKENIYQENVNNSIQNVEDSNIDLVDEDLIHLFTPQYYWNLIFERKQHRTEVPLEDFHLLLYDYERLWNHCLKETF